MKVDVILVTYNNARFVERAIDSILMQEGDCIGQIYCMDDASTDDTVAIMRRRAQEHPNLFTIFVEEVNSRGTKNWIRGVEMGSNPYIHFLGGDKYLLHPQKLIKQVQALEQYPDMVWNGCYTKYSVHPSCADVPHLANYLAQQKYDGRLMPVLKDEHKNIQDVIIFDRHWQFDPIQLDQGVQHAMYRREALEKVYSYPQFRNNRRIDIYQTWVPAIFGTIGFIPIIGAGYEISGYSGWAPKSNFFRTWRYAECHLNLIEFFRQYLPDTEKDIELCKGRVVSSIEGWFYEIYNQPDSDELRNEIENILATNNRWLIELFIEQKEFSI